MMAGGSPSCGCYLTPLGVRLHPQEGDPFSQGSTLRIRPFSLRLSVVGASDIKQIARLLRVSPFSSLVESFPIDPILWGQPFIHFFENGCLGEREWLEGCRWLKKKKRAGPFYRMLKKGLVPLLVMVLGLFGGLVPLFNKGWLVFQCLVVVSTGMLGG